MIFRKTLSAALLGAILSTTAFHGAFAADDTIKVGVLHSLSGTMAISETTLKDAMLMLIDEQNKKGGVLGKKLEAVVVDPASDWPLFAEKARQLISQDKVAAVFGCWTSSSRKSVLPVFEELNSILFYPVQYEGEESSRNIFYTGAAPNQQAIPAVDYLASTEGVERWVLAGTDYVYPQTTNKILKAYLMSKGVKEEDIMINYTPFGHSDWQTIVSDIKKFGSAGKKTAVVSTINGDAKAAPPGPITNFGKYKAGTYQNALKHGHNLGVFASSDHISQHASYGGEFCKDFTREGIIEAFDNRRTIAATDKIYLDFTCNDKPLGSIFETKENAKLWFKVDGTATFKRITIVRNEKDWKEFRSFKGSTFEHSLTDEDMLEGENRYYVRVVQSDGNMAWSSPVWVTKKKP